MAARTMDGEQLEAVIWRTLTRYDPRPLLEDVQRILTAAAAYAAWRDATAARRDALAEAATGTRTWPWDAEARDVTAARRAALTEALSTRKAATR